VGASAEVPGSVISIKKDKRQELLCVEWNTEKVDLLSRDVMGQRVKGMQASDGESTKIILAVGKINIYAGGPGRVLQRRERSRGGDSREGGPTVSFTSCRNHRLYGP
jgi:hypothetical protein